MQENSKHIPMRMCAVTRERLPKKELVRLVKTEEGVQIDQTGKFKGRGVNIKPDIEVFDQAIKKRVLERTLRVNLEEEQKKVLKEEFEKVVKERTGVKQVVRITSEQLSKLSKK